MPSQSILHAFDFRLLPSNESSLLAQALVSQLTLKDLRYSITQVWGPFIADLPCRMGSNEALDSASATILGLHDTESRCVRDGPTFQPIIQQYIRAVKAARVILDDPTRAHEAETLCAVFLLSKASCYFAGPISNFMSPHGSGAAELLKLRGFDHDQEPFESALYDSLRFQVAQETMFNPDLRFTHDQWIAFERSCPDEKLADHLLRCTVKIGHFMTEARCTPCGSVAELAAYFRATQFQQEVERITLELKDELFAYDDTHESDPFMPRKELALKQKLYNRGLVISAAVLLIRRSLAPRETNFDHEIDLLCSRVYPLAEDARVYLPLGAHWMAIGLMVIWCAAKGTAHHASIEALMNEFRRGSLREDATMPQAQLEEIYRQLSLNDRPIVQSANS